jgi:CheY-like chemotaxis protein
MPDVENTLEAIALDLARTLESSGSISRPQAVGLMRARGVGEVQSLLALAYGLEHGLLRPDPRAIDRIDAVRATGPEAGDPDADLFRPRILVVEDDPTLRESLTELLEDEGYCVYSAGDGAEALRVLVKIAKPSVILLDLMMPVMNGWELISALKRDDRFADIPVAVCSAVPQQKPPEIRFIEKPINLVTLIETVEELRAQPH